MRKFAPWFILLVLAIVALAASGCGSSPVASAAAEEIDATSLPATIDVKTAQALQGRDDVVLIDVREQYEYDAGHIPGITLIPMGQVAGRLAEIPNDKTVVVTCRSGNRSGQVTDFLRKQGYTNVHNMAGGILAWEKAGFPVEK